MPKKKVSKPAKKVAPKAATRMNKMVECEQPAVRPLFWALLIVTILVSAFILAWQHHEIVVMQRMMYQQKW